MVDKKFIIDLKGKMFITHGGLLAEFHKNGGNNIETQLISSEKGQYIFRTTASGKSGTFTGYGDADDSNVNTDTPEPSP